MYDCERCGRRPAERVHLAKVVMATLCVRCVRIHSELMDDTPEWPTYNHRLLLVDAHIAIGDGAGAVEHWDVAHEIGQALRALILEWIDAGPGTD